MDAIEKESTTSSLLHMYELTMTAYAGFTTTFSTAESDEASSVTATPRKNYSNVSELEVSQWFHALEVGLLLVLCVIILVSSFIIIGAVLGCKKLHSIPGFLMIGLGTCDIAIALGSMVPSIAAEMVGRWVFGNTICAFQVFATTYFSSVESCFIMLCAVDKALAIAKPLHYAQFRHIYKRLFLGMIVGIICFDFPIPFLFILLSEKIHYHKYLAACVAKIPEAGHADIIFPILVYTLQFFVPGLVIIICYVFIGYKAIQSKRANLRRQQRMTHLTVSRSSLHLNTNGDNLHSRPRSSSMKSPSDMPGSSVGNNSHQEHTTSSLSSFLQHLKMCKMLLVIAIVYFMSFLPIFLYQVMVSNGLLQLNMYHYKIINILQYFNGVIDGVVFYSMSQTFKDQVNLMFCRKRNDTRRWPAYTQARATRAHATVHQPDRARCDPTPHLLQVPQ